MKSFGVALVLVGIVGCAADPQESFVPGTGPSVSDATLYSLMQSDASWTFYKRSATPIARTSQPHPESRALVRYNSRAATQLDAVGKVRSGALFPDSSIIVKELSNASTLVTYAVMIKMPGSASAGPGGWVWAEYGPTGSVKFPTASRGSACTSCHVAGTDYTRMNDSHP
ncbi:MAG: cytochrome P460 family protein [Gemmatimonadaceae bacterium]